MEGNRTSHMGVYFPHDPSINEDLSEYNETDGGLLDRLPPDRHQWMFRPVPP